MGCALFKCSSAGTNSEAATDKSLTPTEKLAADLEAEYGTFTDTFYDSLEEVRFIEYSYKGGLEKPDLFRQSINRSLNLVGKEINLKFDVSSATKSDLGQYVWETPQYRVNFISGVEGDSVFVRLWILE